MKRILFCLLLAFAFGLSSSATCPYDGQTAWATGNTKAIHTINGDKTSCEYAHPINMADAKAGKHVFWQICD